MRLFLLEQLALPTLRRVGTAFGAYMVGIGVQADVVTQITTGMIALGGVSLDLIMSWLERRNRERD